MGKGVRITDQMTNEQYHGDTSRISKSGLDEIAKAPAHYWQKYLNPDRPERETTTAFELGTLFHLLVLEPHRFKDEYIIIPPNAPEYPSTSQWKAQNPSAETRKAIVFWSGLESTYPNHKLIGQVDYDIAQRMKDSVLSHPYAKALLAIPGKPEETILFTEPKTGAPCKCRPDKLTQEDIVIDLKSTVDASPDGFGRSAIKYRYHVQAPFYVDGINESFGHERVREFYFIATEKTPPYLTAVYLITAEDMELGREEYIRNCATYMQCKRSGIWPGYSSQIEALRLPAWAYYKQHK